MRVQSARRQRLHRIANWKIAAHFRLSGPGNSRVPQCAENVLAEVTVIDMLVGGRLLAHARGDSVKIYTRNLACLILSIGLQSSIGADHTSSRYTSSDRGPMRRYWRSPDCDGKDCHSTSRLVGCQPRERLTRLPEIRNPDSRKGTANPVLGLNLGACYPVDSVFEPGMFSLV